MKRFILCCSLLCAARGLAQDAGVAAVTVDAGVVAAAVDAGVVVVAADVADAGVVDASTPVPSLDHPLTSAQQFYTAVKTGNGWLAAVFILFLGVGLVRVVGKRAHAMIPDDTKVWYLKLVEGVLAFFFDTKVGGWLLNWLSAVGGCLSTAIAAGMPVDASAWKVAILASSGGTVLIELKDDVMEWWNRLPEVKPAAPVLAVIAPTPPAPPPVPPVV